MRRAFFLVVIASAAPLCLVHCVGDTSVPASSSVDGGNGGTDSGNTGSDSGAGAVDSGAGGNDVDATNDAGTDAGTPLKQAFATSKMWNGLLGAEGGAPMGVAAGDARCMELAAASFPGRKFHAWLATETAPAKDNIKGSGPWYVGTNKLGEIKLLTSAGTLLTEWLTESGLPRGSTLVWTGTDTLGDPVAGANCKNWGSNGMGDNGAVGLTVGQDGFWTASTQNSCEALHPLYCLEE